MTVYIVRFGIIIIVSKIYLYISDVRKQDTQQFMEKEWNFKKRSHYLTQEQYESELKGLKFTVVGLTGYRGSILNGKTVEYLGVQRTSQLFNLVKIPGDSTIHRIQPRNLVPSGFTLKTILAPFQVMTLQEERQTDDLITAVHKHRIPQQEWVLYFKYVGPQTRYCFNCHLFGTACFDYCSCCGSDYMRLLHVETNKLMLTYKRCQGCMEHGKDLNILGRCRSCWEQQVLIDIIQWDEA